MGVLIGIGIWALVAYLVYKLFRRTMTRNRPAGQKFELTPATAAAILGMLVFIPGLWILEVEGWQETMSIDIDTGQTSTTSTFGSQLARAAVYFAIGAALLFAARILAEKQTSWPPSVQQLMRQPRPTPRSSPNVSPPTNDPFNRSAPVTARFNPPPNWPPPPPGWSPDPSWKPDPSWPPAPPGWQFWIDDSPTPRGELTNIGRQGVTADRPQPMGPGRNDERDAMQGMYSAASDGSSRVPWPGNNTGSKTYGQLLLNPHNVKTLAGGIGILVGSLIVVAGGQQAKVFGLLMIAACWAIFLRHGYHESAGLRLQTRIPAAEAAQIITDLASTEQSAASNVQLTGSQPGQLHFTAYTLPNPLSFRVTLHPDGAGSTSVSTHLVKWTWRQSRSYFIPVPFTKRIDGYGAYKSFATRALDALKRCDPALTGGFQNNPSD